MKKLFLSLVAALTLCGTAQAQQVDYGNKHEVGITYGVYSNSQYFSFLEDLVTLSVTGGSLSNENEKFFGPMTVEYFYRVKPWLGVGGIGAILINNKDGVGGIGAILINNKDLYLHNEKCGTSRSCYFSLLPAVKADWLRREHFGMYSKLGIGVTVLSLKDKLDTGDKESGTAATVNWQLSLIGMEAGGSKLRGFAELGFGEQGIFLAGIRYKF